MAFHRSFGDSICSPIVLVRLHFISFHFKFQTTNTQIEKADTTFSWSDLMLKSNGELLSNVGNLAQRSIKFVNSSYNGAVPPGIIRHFDFNSPFFFKKKLYDLAVPTTLERDLETQMSDLIAQYCDAMDKAQLRDGLRLWLQVSIDLRF